MKIEKINEDKLKITLDVNDLKSRNIDVKSFINNSPESQDLFWDVMQEAEREYGFNVEQASVYVEAHINSAGNFTLLITKSAISSQKQTSSSKTQSPNYKLKRKNYSDSLDDSLFEFANIENLRDFLKIAKNEDYNNVQLYKYENKLYLYINTCFSKDILEYSNRIYNKDYLLARIVEYGSPLYRSESLNSLIKS